MTREDSLVCMAVRAGADVGTADRWRVIGEPLDWSRVHKIASQHGVTSLVFHRLTTAVGMSAADPRLASLRARHLTNAAHSVVLTKELLDVLDGFHGAGIEVLPYKGPAVAAALYGNLALREFTDLDVIVQPRDVLAAAAVLVDRGYHAELDLTPQQQELLVDSRAGYFMRFDRATAGGDIPLELHWRIPATFSFDGAIGHRLAAISLLHREVGHFTPEELLLVLCAHGYKHAWNQLKWICDIDHLVHRYRELDWTLVREQAARLGGLRIFLLGCATASARLGTILPASVVGAIERDRVVPRLAEGLARRVFERPLARAGVLNNFRIRERTTDKIRYGLTLARHLTQPSVGEQLTWTGGRGSRLMHRIGHPLRMVSRVAQKARLKR